MQLIKEHIKSGDVKGAAEALEKLLAAEPDNVEAQMLYGTCCHLLGDDETFKKIHDDLAPKMEGEKDEKKVSLWKKYCRAIATSDDVALIANRHYAEAGKCLMEYLLIAGMVIAALVIAAWLFLKNASTPSLYAGPQYGAPSMVDSKEQVSHNGGQDYDRLGKCGIGDVKADVK